ncbi:MAG: tetratricopeptide repeat protein [Acidobacteria bacterium]|nr:tetratricopeptide repeat protein [Acidobacteriota bacterium]
MSLLRTLTLFAGLLAQAVPPQEQYSVHGSVISDGHPIRKPVVVYLEPLSVKPIENVQTNLSGNFEFRNVPAGSYYVRVEVQGFEETVQRVEVPAFDRRVVIQLVRKANTLPVEIDVNPPHEVPVTSSELNIPEDAAREYQQALTDVRKGKWSRAISGFRRALSIAPTFVQAAFHLGSAFYRAGHFEDAEKVLVRAVKLAPKASYLRLMLANVFVRERKYEKALLEIDAYLKENPESSDRALIETARAQVVEVMRK